MRDRNALNPMFLGVGLAFFLYPLHAENASPSVPSPAPSAPLAAPAKPHLKTYTVESGDTLTYLGHKFNCSAHQIKVLNDLKTTHLKPGLVLQIPASPVKTAAKAPSGPDRTLVYSGPPALPTGPTKAKGTASRRKSNLASDDFDIPASTFASCPVPPGQSEKEEDKTAPSTVALHPAKEFPSSTATATPPVSIQPAPSPARLSTPQVASTGSPISPEKSRRPFSLFSTTPRTQPDPLVVTPANDWGNRFTKEAQALGDQGINYAESWRPPGERTAWDMDCSNTSRYLYKVTTGIRLPRTASDQYYYLHLQQKAWDVPMTASGFADCNYLRRNLQPGDLLFWENTYKPERQPPITHVMIFLGTNEKGQWIMAGSQSSHGMHNRRHGGPDIYVFNPTRPSGGYSTWMGMIHHPGRFCAYGRPLEADASKLAMAANN